MKRIFNFNDFGQKIYEAEGATGAQRAVGSTGAQGAAPVKTSTETTTAPSQPSPAQAQAPKGSQSGLDKDSLDNVVHFALASLVSMAKVRKDPYPEFSQDISAIDGANLDSKEKAFLAMADKIKSSPDSEVPGGKEAMDAWYAVAKRAAEGIGEIKDGIKDDKIAREEMNKEIDSLIQAYKNSLGEKLKSYSGVKESIFINEGLFNRKKDAISNLKNDVVTTLALYAAKRKDPVFGSAYEKAIDALTEFNSKLDSFLSKKNREIKQADIDSLTSEISKIKTDLGNEESTLLKRSDVYTKASEGIRRLLSELETLRRKADSAVSKYSSERTQVESKKQEESKFKIKGNVSYDRTKHGVKNDDVVIFQELAMEKLRPAKARILRRAYDDLDRFGVDGKFGPTTLKTVNAFKAGFEMAEDGIITQELIDKMKGTEKLDESARAIYGFHDFTPIMEGFKVPEFERVWGTDKSELIAKFSGSSSSSASKGSTGKGSKGSKTERKKNNWNFLSKTKLPIWNNFGSVKTLKSKGSDSDDIVRVHWKSTAKGNKGNLDAKKGHISFFFPNGTYKYFKATSSGASGDLVTTGTWRTDGKSMFLKDKSGKTDTW